MLVHITKTIWVRKYGIHDSGAYNAIIPITVVSIMSIYSPCCESHFARGHPLLSPTGPEDSQDRSAVRDVGRTRLARTRSLVSQ